MPTQHRRKRLTSRFFDTGSIPLHPIYRHAAAAAELLDAAAAFLDSSATAAVKRALYREAQSRWIAASLDTILNHNLRFGDAGMNDDQFCVHAQDRIVQLRAALGNLPALASDEAQAAVQAPREVRKVIPRTTAATSTPTANTDDVRAEHWIRPALVDLVRRGKQAKSKRAITIGDNAATLLDALNGNLHDAAVAVYAYRLHRAVTLLLELVTQQVPGTEAIAAVRDARELLGEIEAATAPAD